MCVRVPRAYGCVSMCLHIHIHNMSICVCVSVRVYMSVRVDVCVSVRVYLSVCCMFHNYEDLGGFLPYNGVFLGNNDVSVRCVLASM